MPSQACLARKAVLTEAVCRPTGKLRLRPCLVTLGVNAKKMSQRIWLQDEREVMEMPSKVAPEPADPAARASSKRQRVPCAVEAQAVRG